MERRPPDLPPAGRGQSMRRAAWPCPQGPCACVDMASASAAKAMPAARPQATRHTSTNADANSTEFRNKDIIKGFFHECVKHIQVVNLRAISVKGSKNKVKGVTARGCTAGFPDGAERLQRVGSGSRETSTTGGEREDVQGCRSQTEAMPAGSARAGRILPGQPFPCAAQCPVHPSRQGQYLM